jgi:hypothetical protein
MRFNLQGWSITNFLDHTKSALNYCSFFIFLLQGHFAMLCNAPYMYLLVDNCYNSSEKGFENNVATHSYVISTWTFIFAVGEILGPSAGLIFYKQYSFAVFSFSLAALNILMGIIYTVFLYCKINNHNVFCSFNVTIYFQ